MARRRREEAERIGARIAELRDRAHLTQPAAAERAGVALRTYQTWEAGDATPRWHNYERLAKLFGVTVEAILSGEPANESATSDRLERVEQLLLVLNEKVDAIAEALAVSELEQAAAELESAAAGRQDVELGGSGQARRGAASRRARAG